MERQKNRVFVEYLTKTICQQRTGTGNREGW